MRLNGLRTFRNVYELGSISAAAKRQNLSQPAVSRMLSSLEQSIEMKLFIRNGPRLLPTLEGEEFYAQTHRLLASIDELPRIAKDIRSASHARIRILTMRRVASEVVLPVVAQLHKDSPEIEFQIDIIARRELEVELTKTDYDIAVATLPISGNVATIETVSVQKLYVVVPNDHPLSRNAVLDIRQLLDTQIVALPNYTQHRREMDELFRSFSGRPKIAITVTSIEPAIELVSKGVGITFSDGIMWQSAAKLGCVLLPLSPARSVTYALIRPPIRAAHPGIDQFVDATRARFADLSDTF